MPRLTIISLLDGGHHSPYLRRIIAGMQSTDFRLEVLTLPTTMQHPAYNRMREDFGERVSWTITARDLDKQQTGDIRTFSLLRMNAVYHGLLSEHFRALSAGERPDLIFAPYADSFFKLAAIKGSPFDAIPWAGLVMSNTFHLPEMGAVRSPRPHDPLYRWLYLRLLRQRNLRAMFCIDELLAAYIRDRHPDLARKLTYVADPVDACGTATRQSARELLGLGDAKAVILVYGAMGSGKGLRELLAASALPTFPSQATILVAGCQNPMSRALLAEPTAAALIAQGRLKTIDRFLSDEEEYAAFKSSDIVWVGYRRHYFMSGVLIQAGLMDLPVAACREGLIGWTTNKYGIGVTMDVDDPSDVASTISSLLNDPDLYERCAQNGHTHALEHSAERFAGAIRDVLVRC